MFGKGDYIVYGTTGVCRVRDITAMASGETGAEKMYYVLEPMGVAGSRIMNAEERNNSVQRPTMSR